MNFIQLVRCYVLLKVFASKSHTILYIFWNVIFNNIQILWLGVLWYGGEKGASAVISLHQ